MGALGRGRCGRSRRACAGGEGRLEEDLPLNDRARKLGFWILSFEEEMEIRKKRERSRTRTSSVLCMFDDEVGPTFAGLGR